MAEATVALARRILARADDAPVVVLEGHATHAQAVAFTPDGTLFLTCGDDAHIRLWRPPGFRLVGWLQGHTRPVHSLSLSADGALVVSVAADQTARVWSLADRKVRRIWNGQVAAALSPDGRRVATITAKYEVNLWRVDTGEQIATLEKFDTRLFGLVFAPNGQHLLIGGTGAIHRVNADDLSGRTLLRGHGAYVAAMRFSPNGDMLASCGGEGALRLWSASNWREMQMLPLKGRGSMQLAFEPNNRLLAVSTEGGIELRALPDAHASERIHVPANGVFGLAFSPDGRYLAGAADDGRVRIWATRLAKLEGYKL